MLGCPECRTTYPDDMSECPVDGATLVPSEVPSADAPLAPGTMAGEYRVERRLGAGSFGEVYAGEQPLIGKRVAIKLLHKRLSSEPHVVSRFIAEARAVNRIRHRNIIDIFSFGMLDGQRHYFVMELLDGLTLGELLRRDRRIPIAKAIPILRGVADALDAAHEADVTHRDLKPDNIFLALEKDGSYFPKLLDFGVAKLVIEDAAHKTATGVAIGTPRYMSPEQCRGKRVDHRTDIYAFGAVIHEMLTGRPVFDGDSALDVLFKHTTDPPPAMSSVNAELPAELDAPVLAMLAKRPQHRPASAGAAVAALLEQARTVGLATAVSAEGASADAARSSKEQPPPRAQAATVQIARKNPQEPRPPEAAEIATVAKQPLRSTANDPTLVSPQGISAGSVENAASGHTMRASVSPASGTLLSEGGVPPTDPSPGPIESAKAAGVSAHEAISTLGGVPSPPRSSTPPRAGARWPMLLLAGAGVALGAIALLRSSGKPAPDAATAAGPMSAAPTVATSATSSAAKGEAAQLVADAPASAAPATSSAERSPRATPSAATPKAPGKAKLPTDLERPPEFGHSK